MSLAAAWVVVLVGASPPPVKLGAPGLAGTGFAKEQLAAFGEQLASSFRTVSVVTQADVASLLGLERQRQLLGCGESGACMAELSAALGVDGLLLGDVTKLEGVTQVNLRVVASGDGKRLAGCSARVSADGQLFGALERCAGQLEHDVLVALGRVQPARAWWPWIPAVLGVAAVGAGAGLAVSSAGDLAVLRGMARPATETRSALQVKSDGELKQALALAAFGVGGAAVVTAVLGWVLGGSGASAWLAPALSGVGFAWRWP